MGIKLGTFIITMLVLLAVCLIAIVTYSAVKPYSPYHLQSYTIKPNTQCMGDVVELYPTRVLDKGIYDVHVDPYWQSVSNGEIIEEPISTSLAIEGRGVPENERSQLAQEVPEKPGLWTHHVEVRVEGRVGILPRTQIIHKEAESAMRVLPNSDDRCKQGAINYDG